MPRRLSRLAMLSLAAVLAACGASDGPRRADTAVEWFHGRYNEDDYASIYREADPDLRATTDEEQFVHFMESMKAKLGTADESSRTGVNLNVSTSGTRVTAGYQTAFTQGPGVETFVYRVRGEKVRLVSYNLNSAVLLE